MQSFFGHIFQISVHIWCVRSAKVTVINGSVITTGITLWYTERSTQCWVSCTWCCCICLLGIWSCILSCRYEKHIGTACSSPFNGCMLWSWGTQFPLYSIPLFIQSDSMQNCCDNFSPSYSLNYMKSRLIVGEQLQLHFKRMLEDKGVSCMALRLSIQQIIFLFPHE